MHLENENKLAGLEVQVKVMARYGIISLGKKLTHNCLSQLRNINEYLVLRWQRPPTATKSINHWGPGGTSGATPQLVLQSVLLRAPSQAPEDCLARPIAPT